jgi:hypothetical protein
LLFLPECRGRCCLSQISTSWGPSRSQAVAGISTEAALKWSPHFPRPTGSKSNGRRHPTRPLGVCTKPHRDGCVPAGRKESPSLCFLNRRPLSLCPPSPLLQHLPLRLLLAAPFGTTYFCCPPPLAQLFLCSRLSILWYALAPPKFLVNHTLT